MAESVRPAWFERVAGVYLEGGASLFLIRGGDPKEIESAALTILSRTRPLVGVVSPERGLTFPNLGDLARFEQILGARRVFGGLPRLRSERPLEALGQLWAILEVADPPQGWILRDPGRLFPVKRQLDPIPGAPALAAWADAPRLRDHDHLILMIEGPTPIAPELVEKAYVIDARATPRPAAPLRLVHDADVLPPTPPGVFDDEPDEPGDDAPPPPPPAPRVTAVDAALAVPPDLAARLEASLSRRMSGWPAASWPSRAPVMAAVAGVFADLPTPLCGPIELAWNADDGVQVTGPGADWFLARWQADVAIDAAAGMIVKAMQPPEDGYPEGGVPPTDPVGTRVLCRRLERWFAPL